VSQTDWVNHEGIRIQSRNVTVGKSHRGVGLASLPDSHPERNIFAMVSLAHHHHVVVTLLRSHAMKYTAPHACGIMDTLGRQPAGAAANVSAGAMDMTHTHTHGLIICNTGSAGSFHRKIEVVLC
jgi:hypothetical protein